MADDKPMPAAGWYSDPLGSARRRYWDGSAWTEHFAGAELPAANSSPRVGKAIAGFMIFVAALIVALGVAGAVQGQESVGSTVLIFAVGIALLALIRPVQAAFQYYERRRQRQEASDRARALAINADTEDAAYIRGDDLRGVYGQFPLPPELRDQDR